MARPPQFEGLNDVDAATARRRFKILRVEAGEVLAEEGSEGRALLCLVEGELEVRRGSAMLGVLGPGALLGETALFEDAPRTATIAARTPAVVWALERSGYEELRDTLHPVCRNLEVAILAEQVVRLQGVADRVAELMLGTPVQLPQPGFFASVRRIFGFGGMRAESGDARRALGRSRLFADAPQPVLEAMADRWTTWRADAGEVLCTEGERGRKVFLLDEGQVDVVVASDDEPKVVSTLEPGTLFGMVSLASGAPRMSTCVTRDSARIHVLDEVAWRELADDTTMIGSSFRRATILALAEQLRHSNGQLAEAARDPSDPARGSITGRLAQVRREL